MAQLQTVQGPIDTSQMGTTLIHEHVLFQFDDSRRERSIEFVARLLHEAQQAGVRTVVDLTPLRRIDWFMEIAGLVGVHIVACTGYYLERLTPRPLAALDESQMVDRMVRELTEGIDTTGVRAGIIKVAADLPQLTPWEVQVFTAAARAHLKTGACIATHACAGSREQAEVLQRAGADLNRVFFSHVEAEFGWEGRTVREEAGYLEAIARQGGSLLFNNFGFEFDTAWPDLTYLLHHLCDAGYQDKVLMSVDCNWTWNEEGAIEFEAEREHPETARRTFAYLMTEAVPALLEAGFTEQDIHTFVVENPRRFFERSGLQTGI
jgi:phosphotriesterase-related protein